MSDETLIPPPDESTTARPAKKSSKKKRQRGPKAASPAASKPLNVQLDGETETESPRRRGFEVLGTIDLGRINGAPNVRVAGQTVYEDELEPDMIRYLLEKREIADRNAPIPPSMAEKVLAFDHLLDVARRVGAVEVDGAKLRLAGEEDWKVGLVAFRAAVSIDQLKNAIVQVAME